MSDGLLSTFSAWEHFWDVGHAIHYHSYGFLARNQRWRLVPIRAVLVEVLNLGCLKVSEGVQYCLFSRNDTSWLCEKQETGIRDAAKAVKRAGAASWLTFPSEGMSLRPTLSRNAQTTKTSICAAQLPTEGAFGTRALTWDIMWHKKVQTSANL